jgi:hypothetical protein
VDLLLLSGPDLGFLLCKDEDLSDVGPEWGVLEDSTGDVTVHLCLKFAGLGGIWSCGTMFLFLLEGPT